MIALTAVIGLMLKSIITQTAVSITRPTDRHPLLFFFCLTVIFLGALFRNETYEVFKATYDEFGFLMRKSTETETYNCKLPPSLSHICTYRTKKKKGCPQLTRLPFSE